MAKKLYISPLFSEGLNPGEDPMQPVTGSQDTIVINSQASSVTVNSNIANDIIDLQLSDSEVSSFDENMDGNVDEVEFFDGVGVE